EGELTRGAAAKIIVSLLIGPEAAEALPTTNSPYPDVPAGNVFAGYISFCKTEKIINGYNDGTFRPTGTLTGFAFAKMLLSALGYDGNIEGFTGSGWTVRVSALGSKANLFNRLDFKGGETVNRETACLLALNTLKATMVQYTGGMNITTSDGSTMVVNPTREYVTSNQDYAAHIDNRKVSDQGNSTSESHYTVEFGEEHFKDLRMDRERENSDQFGRPSNEWSYKKVTIGTYPIAADFTYTTQVIHCVESTTAASKTRALGLSGYEVVGPKEATRDKQTKVWLNGTQVDGISDVSEIADYTDNGTLVEVYVSDEDADFITDVVVVKTQLMEVKRVGSDYVSLDLYDDGSDSEGKAVFGYNSVPIDKKVNDVEVDDDCYNQLKEMKAGDIVAVVPVAPDHNDENTYDVAKVYAPETATGNLSRVETYGKIGEQNAIGVTVGGTAYKIALWNKDLKDINGEVVNLTKKDVTVYLDEYGNALLAKDVGGTKDWMVIKNYRQGLVNGVIVTYVNGWDIDGNEVTLNIGGGSVADYAKANYKPGDLVRYESDSSSNTAEWALSMTESKGVFNVAKFRDDGTTPYTISASNTTIRLDDFDVTAGISANKNLATIDNGIKFIYVSVDKDGEVDGIEFVSGVKSADNDEIIGKDSSAQGVKNAQACVSLKDGAVKDSSAVKAVVIKRESTDASVSNLLYISKYLGSATRHDGGTGNNNNIVYSYEVVMMGPGGKLVDDDMTIYSYKNLKIGQFARYTKATAPEGMDGVNNDNFYDLRGYGVDSGSSSADDTFGRSAAVVKATVVESLKQNKYLLKVADYGETTARALSEDPKIAGIYSSDTELDLGDDQAKNLVNARGAAWVDLRDVKDKIDDIDSLKELVNDKNTPVRVTMLFNDNPDSDDFRRVYLIIIHGATTYNPGPTGGAVSPSLEGAFEPLKDVKVGDEVTITLEAGFEFDVDKQDSTATSLGGGKYKINSIPAVIAVKKTTSVEIKNAKVVTQLDAALTNAETYPDGAPATGLSVDNIKTYPDKVTCDITFVAPEWAAPTGNAYVTGTTDVAAPKFDLYLNGMLQNVVTGGAPVLADAKTGTFKTSVMLAPTAAAVQALPGGVLSDADTLTASLTEVKWTNVKVLVQDENGDDVALVSGANSPGKIAVGNGQTVKFQVNTTSTGDKLSYAISDGIKTAVATKKFVTNDAAAQTETADVLGTGYVKVVVTGLGDVVTNYVVSADNGTLETGMDLVTNGVALEKFGITAATDKDQVLKVAVTSGNVAAGNKFKPINVTVTIDDAADFADGYAYKVTIAGFGYAIVTKDAGTASLTGSDVEMSENKVIKKSDITVEKVENILTVDEDNCSWDGGNVLTIAFTEAVDKTTADKANFTFTAGTGSAATTATKVDDVQISDDGKVLTVKFDKIPDVTAGKETTLATKADIVSAKSEDNACAVVTIKFTSNNGVFELDFS
ncbi:MAG: S-layer homology domain-containing protein, partial [Oscillibacter sp.]|nr:S-layer homology domain-containing protein [Oscillibacter sp.]